MRIQVNAYVGARIAVVTAPNPPSVVLFNEVTESMDRVFDHPGPLYVRVRDTVDFALPFESVTIDTETVYDVPRQWEARV